MPVLQLHGGWLTKTRQFRGNPYLGDPVNAVRIFNELEVDELVLCDVSASRGETPLNPGLIESIASEAFMPVAYGGGISSVEDAKSLVRSGIEKVIVNTAVITTPTLVSALVAEFGAQSVVASVDFGFDDGVASAHIQNGRSRTNLTPVEFAEVACRLGVGELIVNSIDRDGTLAGYDLRVVNEVSTAVDVPVVALGGAGELTDFRDAIDSGAAAAAAGSKFIYYGRNHAVLVTYPDTEALDDLWSAPIPYA